MDRKEHGKEKEKGNEERIKEKGKVFFRMIICNHIIVYSFVGSTFTLPPTCRDTEKFVQHETTTGYLLPYTLHPIQLSHLSVFPLEYLIYTDKYVFPLDYFLCIAFPLETLIN
jgi:hypothetical protein